MKKISILSLLSLVIFISSCKKDDATVPSTVNTPEEKNSILSNTEWVLEDVTFHYKYKITVQGTVMMEMDTIMSVWKDAEACSKDMSFFFRPTSIFEMVEGPTYCKDDRLQDTDKEEYRWRILDNYARLQITGKDAGGIVYHSDASTTSIGDTLNMNIVTIKKDYLETLYNIPLDEVYADAGMDKEMMDEMGMKFEGVSNATYIWKKK